MKQSYHFYNNISSVFTGTYKKLDNPQRSKVHILKKNGYSTLNVDLNKELNQPKKLSRFVKIITQFFSLKEALYTNGTKVCTDEFLFDRNFN